MIHFLRLIRTFNLLIIVATMYGLGWYFDELFVRSGYQSVLLNSSFFLLVFSTVLIAAAGNIINDYFDVKADRINRPKTIVIGKHIKRRWGIVLHWLINLIAFTIAAYLSYLFETFWYLFIHLLSINLLVFYSMQLKRTAVMGNVTIAVLTAFVPILVGIYYNQHLDGDTLTTYYPFRLSSVEQYPIYISIGMALFAFFLNWAREITKDIEDIPGDKILNAKTLPLTLGIRKSKRIVLILLVTPIFFTSFLIYAYHNENILTLLAFIPILVAAIVLIIALFLGVKANIPSQFKTFHLLIKFIMIIGLTLPVFWVILLRLHGVS